MQRSRSITSGARQVSGSATRTSTTCRTSRRRRREGIQADVAAAVEWLRMRAGVDSVFTVGFCMGGRQSWLSAAGRHGLAGAVGFYGRPGQGQDGAPGPAQRAGEMDVPDPGAAGWRRPEHHGRGQRRVRRRRSRRRASSTRWSRTTARRTASSTGARRTSRPHPTTRGRGSSHSSTDTGRRSGAGLLPLRHERDGRRKTTRASSATPSARRARAEPAAIYVED